MTNYHLPEIVAASPVETGYAILVASGDMRLSANQMCWTAQEDMEQRLIAAFAAEGITIRRGHPYDPVEKHGFISSQRMGMEVFKTIHPEAPLIVAEAVWQLWKVAPDAVVTGPVWNMTPTVQYIIAQVTGGTYTAQDLKDFSMYAKGGASLADWHGWDSKLPGAVVTLVKDKEGAIKAGLFRVDISELAPSGE